MATFEDDGMKHVTKDEWTAMEGAGEFATTWKDLYKHETCTYKYAITKASLDEAKEKELLCVCDVPTAAMADQIKEKYGDETMAIFVGPATIEEYERRLREYFTETDRDLEERLIAAEAEKKRGLDSGLWQSTICLDDPDVAYERLKDIVIQERPDVLPARSQRGQTNRPSRPLRPHERGERQSTARSTRSSPQVRVRLQQTTRAAKEGEQAGVHYEYVDRASFESDIAGGKFVEYAEIERRALRDARRGGSGGARREQGPRHRRGRPGRDATARGVPAGAFCLVALERRRAGARIARSRSAAAAGGRRRRPMATPRAATRTRSSSRTSHPSSPTSRRRRLPSVWTKSRGR